ncbi:J-domain-containing protein [Actinomadura sp. WAC 06369]|uniref:DnaJ family domain-containing protein n=1 Tax=Actinomadura sp. WAC 06369 TaxID=2203193 RepID=UPI000F7A4691|nr:DUF1992 domain-containing protein [Actinomadura sp. WAC 06369]RSN71313.1 DUF1992 domain-containing protein [Actinomadura sp. WAC 06369]
MTERKPVGMGFETWIDRQIRQARERGAFDDLPGAGKPLTGLDRPFSVERWAVDKARREGLDTEALLPEPLRLRKEVDRLPGTVRGLRSEREVRELVGDLNRRIAESLRRPSEVPVVVRRVDPDAVVERWRDARAPAAEAPATEAPAAPGPAPAGRGRSRRRAFPWRRKPRD